MDFNRKTHAKPFRWRHAMAFMLLVFTVSVAGASARATWTVDGKAVEGELISIMGDNVVFKTSNGKQVKFPYEKLSAEDKEYITLSEHPKFKVDFVKSSSTRNLQISAIINSETPPRINDFSFGAKIKQASAGDYPYELEIEYFAIGQEKTGDKFILLDRDKRSFTLTKENKLSYSFMGDRKVEIMDYVIHDTTFGRQYAGNLVTITDKRGEIIAHTTSNKWLFENIEALKKLPIGAYFDETCERKYPTPPQKWY